MLKVCEELLAQFEQQNILYCHWKGNEHVNKGLNGIGDIDILVSLEMKEKCSALLNSLKFIRVITQKEQRYENIEDWISLDSNTGKLVHLHLYYELKVGYKYVNEYTLPFGHISLNNREFDLVNNIYVQNPCVELLILYSRMILEKPKNERSKMKYEASFSFLINKIALDDFVNILVDAGIDGESREEFLHVLNHKTLNEVNVEKIESAIKKIVIKNSNIARFKYYTWKFRITFRNILIKYNNNSTIITKKLLPTRGFICVLDDKNSADQIKKWLNWKIETKKFDVKFDNKNLNNTKKIINDLENYIKKGGIAILDSRYDCGLAITNLSFKSSDVVEINSMEKSSSNLSILKIEIWNTINSRKREDRKFN